LSVPVAFEAVLVLLDVIVVGVVGCLAFAVALVMAVVVSALLLSLERRRIQFSPARVLSV